MKQDDYQPGQRWISNTELQLGLGTILSVDARSVQVAFLATGETRTYSRETAPLSRVTFSLNDHITSQDGWTMTVTDIEHHNGLLVYFGTREDNSEAILPESQIDHLMQLNQPVDRLLTGQVDKPALFRLRRDTRRHINRLLHSELHGLIGTRTSLIPHQLYIANEVSRRYAPRVLLADEVGLGKTIEAGLIIHRQLLTERAQRVLIVVPETLVHQWLVEMLRRFNLLFSVFDEERCQAVEDSGELDNPFESEQLIICSLSFLTQYANRHNSAVTAGWDLLVVDEAHHLHWSQQEASNEYQCIEQLSQSTKGILLLTATPEQLGKTGHFARLRLLDPDRFPDFDQFVEEEKHYEPIAAAVENLLDRSTLSQESIDVLSGTMDEGDNQTYLDQVIDAQCDAETRDYARNRLIEHLLDRHGTGRVLFRNTRHAVKGFPQRECHAATLPLPGQYKTVLQNHAATTSNPARLLSPERIYEHDRTADQPVWTELDPRVNWLFELLQNLKPDKVLVITASAETTLELAEHLQKRSGIHAAVFHEGMNIIERDRAAAFFASQEEGSQVLLCSEIGSEGRNFQFAHHLVLFDLPLNPDLLEQRIGRLDRIGQTQTIRIHVPCLQGSAQESMFHWYHEGLQAFEHTCPAGHSVFVEVEQELINVLRQSSMHESGQPEYTALIDRTAQLLRQYNDTLQQGRDRLLEFSSCRPDQATKLVDTAIEQSREKELADYLDHVFDNFGIESEIHSQTSFVIRPGDHVRTHLPGLTEDGLTITYHRTTALANEDMQFMTWEHPLVTAAMDTIINTEIGNTTMVTIKHKGLQPGSLFIECLYNLVPASSQKLDTARYLSNSTLRVVIDQQGKQYQTSLTHAVIEKIQDRIPREVVSKIIKGHAAALKKMLAVCDKLVSQHVPVVVDKARQQVERDYNREVDRLVALKTINPNIRDEEITFFRQEKQLIIEQLDATVSQLDAIRVMIVVD